MQRRAPPLHRMRAKMARYAWLALFQQRPPRWKVACSKRSDWRFWRYGDAAANTVGQPILLGEEDAHQDLAGAYRFNHL